MQLNPLKVEINKVFKIIEVQSGDPVALLESANQLTTYNYNLAIHYIALLQEATNMEQQYKRDFDKSFLSYRKLGKTIEDAKANARLENATLEHRKNKAEIDSKELSLLRVHLRDKVSVIQSYCSNLKDQRLMELRNNKL